MARNDLPHQPNVDPEFAEAVQESLNEKLVWHEEIPVGSGRKVYRCRTSAGGVIVKRDTHAKILLTQMASTQLSKAGVPTPEILAIESSEEFPFLVMKEITDPSLASALSKGLPLKGSLTNLGETLAAMHSIHFESAGWFDAASFPLLPKEKAQWEEFRREPWGLKDLVTHGLVDSTTADLVRKYALENLDLSQASEPVFIHGDLSTGHIFVSEDGWRVTAIIDFGDVRSDDATWDFVWFWLHEKHLLAAILEGYRSLSGLPDNFRGKLKLFGLLRLIGEAAWLKREGFELGDRIQRLATWGPTRDV